MQNPETDERAWSRVCFGVESKPRELKSSHKLFLKTDQLITQRLKFCLQNISRS